MESDSPGTPKEERDVSEAEEDGEGGEVRKGPLPTSTELLNRAATLKKRNN